MDRDAKILTEQYEKVTEALKDTVHSAIYTELVDCYYEIVKLGQSPKTDPVYLKTAFDGIRDTLKALRKQLPHLEAFNPEPIIGKPMQRPTSVTGHKNVRLSNEQIEALMNCISCASGYDVIAPNLAHDLYDTLEQA